MNRDKEKVWLASNGHRGHTRNGVENMERQFTKMILGVGMMINQLAPSLLQRPFVWLDGVALYVAGGLVRIFRLTLVAVIWVAIVFGPLALYANMICAGWMLLALIASIWGLRRELSGR